MPRTQQFKLRFYVFIDHEINHTIKLDLNKGKNKTFRSNLSSISNISVSFRKLFKIKHIS